MSSQQRTSRKGKHRTSARRIVFFYRPKVEVEHASSLGDVQRFLMLLEPQSREGAPARVLVIGKKRLPAPTARERFFGCVEATATTVDPLLEGLGERKYETKTLGTRHVRLAMCMLLCCTLRGSPPTPAASPP